MIKLKEGQNRPFKCHPCNIAFRISGHLSRHIKSRGHQLKVSQDEMVSLSAFLFGHKLNKTSLDQ